MAAAAPGAAFPMDMITAEREIENLVKVSDLDQLTSAIVRKHLQKTFGIDFTTYKSRVDEMTRKSIEKLQNKKTATKEKEKEENDSSGSDSEADAAVKKDIGNKKKKSVKREGSEFNDLATTIKSTRRAAASKAIKIINKTRVRGSKKPSDPNEDNSGKFGRMTKLCYISPELQELVGSKYMKRCDVVKKIWDYIKENDLKDPKLRQFVICDELLERIFKKKRFKAFGMAKFLTRHVINTADMDVEYQQEAKAEMNRLRQEMLQRKEDKEREERNKSNGDDNEDKDSDSGEPDSKRKKLEEDEDEDEKKDDGDKSDSDDSDSD